jgi:hypothetical protein
VTENYATDGTPNITLGLHFAANNMARDFARGMFATPSTTGKIAQNAGVGSPMQHVHLLAPLPTGPGSARCRRNCGIFHHNLACPNPVRNITRMVFDFTPILEPLLHILRMLIRAPRSQRARSVGKNAFNSQFGEHTFQRSH